MIGASIFPLPFFRLKLIFLLFDAVLRGENFTPDLTVWVGDTPSPLSPILKSSTLLLFRPPPFSSSTPSIHQQPGMPFLASPLVPSNPNQTRISLVRHDGVVFRTYFTVPEKGAGKRRR
jgi:hypothetical protein